MAGQTFGDLAFFFDDGIVLALVNRRTGVCTVTPPPQTVVSNRVSLAHASVMTSTGAILSPSVRLWDMLIEAHAVSLQIICAHAR